MGGVRVDKTGAAYGLKGLFSAGESACWDMHGFNRLGGNSLAETVVAGSYIGKQVAQFLQGYDVDFKSSAIRDAHNLVAERIKSITTSAKGRESCFQLRNEMQDVMMEHVGIFRNAKDLQAGVEKLQALYERSLNIGLQAPTKGFTPEMSMALRVPGMLKLALCTAYGALQRTESRGAHTREDFPERNDRDWLNRTLAYWKDGETLPVLKYEEASPYYELPPGDRGYGGGKIITADLPAEKFVVPGKNAPTEAPAAKPAKSEKKK
jgi:fumarate reductase flavoprotein subunit